MHINVVLQRLHIVHKFKEFLEIQIFWPWHLMWNIFCKFWDLNHAFQFELANIALLI
jgi:hypothetical protein